MSQRLTVLWMGPIVLWTRLERTIMYYVYFIQSQKNDKIYVGKTSKDPAVRTKEHNAGSNRWTSKNRPFNLVYYESYICEKDALSRENFYKTGLGKAVKKAICGVIQSTGRSSDG